MCSPARLGLDCWIAARNSVDVLHKERMITRNHAPGMNSLLQTGQWLLLKWAFTTRYPWRCAVKVICETGIDERLTPPTIAHHTPIHSPLSSRHLHLVVRRLLLVRGAPLLPVLLREPRHVASALRHRQRLQLDPALRLCTFWWGLGWIIVLGFPL